MTQHEKIVRMLKIAAESGISSGLIHDPNNLEYVMQRCRAVVPDGTTLLFTRESGYHSGGWWKNPDYERCYHLSVSFFDPETLSPRPFSQKDADHWVKMFFRGNERLLWCEPPATKNGRALGVWHYRLFCDEGWQPIKPRGEVYGREFTEAGWKSFSEIHGEKP